jgi:hypothetical protein
MRFRACRPNSIIVAVAFAAGLALAGCGGSSSSSRTVAQRSPTVATTTVGVAPAGSALGARHKSGGAAGTGRHPDTASGTGHKAQSRVAGRRAGATGAKRGGRTRQPTTVKVSGPPPLNPCTLVSGSEAQTIVGASLRASREAPLGPTCVFNFKGSRPVITLAIESVSFQKTVRHMKKSTRLAVAGLEADCGNLGEPMLFVSLSGGRVLNVTAPCPIARAFAARALNRLHA